MVVKNNAVDYANDYLKNFISQVKNYDETRMLDLKVFKFFKNTTNEPKLANNCPLSTMYSLSELMEKT